MTENSIITQDKNLQTYLTGDPETFVKLCRKFCHTREPLIKAEFSGSLVKHT